MNRLWEWVAVKFCEALVRGWEMAQERITGRGEERPALTNGKKERVHVKD